MMNIPKRVVMWHSTFFKDEHENYGSSQKHHKTTRTMMFNLRVNKMPHHNYMLIGDCISSYFLSSSVNFETWLWSSSGGSQTMLVFIPFSN